MLSNAKRAERGAEVDDDRERDAGQLAADDRADDTRHGRQHEGDDDHVVLVQRRAQPRADRVACHRAERRQPHGEPEPPRGGILGAEREREVEQHEPHAAPQQQHRHGRELQARRRQLDALALRRRSGGHHVTWEAGRRHECDGEEDRAVPQRRRAPERDLEQRGREHGGDAGDAGDQPELRVRLDELALGAHHARHEGRLRHAVRLLQHERREHEWEQRQLVGETHHQQLQHDAGRGDRLHDEAASAPDAVDDRADQRRDDQERGEADDEEQQHLAARRARVDVEEERVGEGDHHRRLAAHHRRVGEGEPAELRSRSIGRAHEPRCYERSYL